MEYYGRTRPPKARAKKEEKAEITTKLAAYASFFVYSRELVAPYLKPRRAHVGTDDDVFFGQIKVRSFVQGV